jgi:hypothetical protein
MKLLVIAYEFPPILSGQSIRWFHLANALADLGVDVHVLAPAFPDRQGFRGTYHQRVVVHRCFPGPFIGLAARLAERLGGEKASSSSNPSSQESSHARWRRPHDWVELGYRSARGALNHLLFPDVRSEWFPSAWITLRRLVSHHGYDLIVSSHEPGVTLLLGLSAQRRWKLPWLVDMGDPLVGPLTPTWRRRLDLKAEQVVCRRADRLVVTCPEMLDLLPERHRRLPRHELSKKLAVITQGFPTQDAAETAGVQERESDGRFTLLFTGTLNSPLRRVFRTGIELKAALGDLSLRDVQLVLAGSAHTRGQSFEELGETARVLGMIAHGECLALQRRATVLLSVANDRHYQLPGKLFEYFGASRPILHLTVGARDPAARLVRQLRRGLVVENERTAILGALRTLHGWWRNGELDQRFDLSFESVQEYAWPSLALRFLRECERARGGKTGGTT